MSPLNFTQDAFAACFPRVSGDEPATPQPISWLTPFSPRERG